MRHLGDDASSADEEAKTSDLRSSGLNQRTSSMPNSCSSCRLGAETNSPHTLPSGSAASQREQPTIPHARARGRSWSRQGLRR